MTDRPVRLYGIPLSHPTVAARQMLELKRLPYRYVSLVPGLHPPSLLALGFRGVTVPAMALPDGRRVQGSLAIAQELERLAPEPPLYPPEPEDRRAAEDAERWGEQVLQPIPRRLARWGLRNRTDLRRWYAELTRLPAPQLAAAVMAPILPLFVRQAGATDERIQSDLAQLPALLDEVDRLIERGVIGGEPPGAADLQIASSVRVLVAMADIRPLVAGRPAEAFAMRLVPDYPEIPDGLPAEWLPSAAS